MGLLDGWIGLFNWPNPIPQSANPPIQSPDHQITRSPDSCCAHVEDSMLDRVAAACLVASWLLMSVGAAAQATGAITGLVSDSSGGVLPGVAIDVANQDTGQV